MAAKKSRFALVSEEAQELHEFRVQAAGGRRDQRQDDDEARKPCPAEGSRGGTSKPCVWQRR